MAKIADAIRGRLVRVVNWLTERGDTVAKHIDSTAYRFMRWIAEIENPVVRTLAFVFLGAVPLIVGFLVGVLAVSVAAFIALLVMFVGISMDVVRGRGDLL